MGVRVSVLILADADTNHVFGAVEQIRRQSCPEHEILVLCGPAVSDRGLGRQPRLSGVSPVRWVAVEGESLGAWRNAGLAAATGDAAVFVGAGDRIDPRFLEAVSAHLSSNSDLSFVTCWPAAADPRGHAAVRPELTLQALIGRVDSIPTTTVFKRSAWQAIGRFDESLPGCEWADFWIRLLAAGHRGGAIEEALVGYEPSRASFFRKGLDPERHAGGIRAVFTKHRVLFSRFAVAALCDRETDLRALSGPYRRLLARRDGLVAERAALRESVERVAADLRDANREAFDWGDLRRVLPVSPDWGYERGTPIDRYYIERFLDAHSGDVQGTVLEIQEPDYTRRFGAERVLRSDVIDIDAANPRANLTGDLRRLEAIPADSYDCFVLTQTIHVIDDMRAVLAEAHRILKPGGVLLVTMPCASRVCLEYGPDGDFWRVTEAGARRLFSDFFPPGHLEIQSFGNVLTNVAFLEGLACHEVSAEEFEILDPFNPLLVGIRAVKPDGVRARPPRARKQGSGAILLYHRVAAPPLDVHGLCVSAEVFRAQMAHLAKEYRPVPLIQLAMAAREGWLPQRAVAVTFDDGYFDNLETASPILLELGIPATFFLTSDGLLGRREFWWDVLAWIFFGGRPLPRRLTLDGEPLPTATAEERQQTHESIYHRVRRGTRAERERLLGQIRDWAGAAFPDGLARILDGVEIEDLARRAGHSIGGHGTDHLSFSSHGADTVRRDVSENRSLLEAAIGRTISCFAYPFGDHDDRAVEQVAAAGYRAAVTCAHGLVRPGADPLRLPRIEVRADGASFEESLAEHFARTDGDAAGTEESREPRPR